MVVKSQPEAHTVSVASAGVLVGVTVGGIGEGLGGTGVAVAVGGTSVGVGGIGVSVGDGGVAVGSGRVTVGGTGVAVGGAAVGGDVAHPVRITRAMIINVHRSLGFILISSFTR
jgi:hypothetical protein